MTTAARKAQRAADSAENAKVGCGGGDDGKPAVRWPHRAAAALAAAIIAAAVRAAVARATTRATTVVTVTA